MLGDVSATRGASYVIHLHPDVWYAAQLRDVTSSYALVSVQAPGPYTQFTCNLKQFPRQGYNVSRILNLQAKFSLGLKLQTTFLTDLPFLVMTSLIYSDLDTLTYNCNYSFIKLDYILPKAGLLSFKVARPWRATS